MEVNGNHPGLVDPPVNRPQQPGWGMPQAISPDLTLRLGQVVRRLTKAADRPRLALHPGAVPGGAKGALHDVEVQGFGSPAYGPDAFDLPMGEPIEDVFSEGDAPAVDGEAE